MPAHDERLLLRELRSDRAEPAARALYRTYAGELYGFALHRLGDRVLAEGVVREVFARVWSARSAYDPGRGSVRTWLYGVAHEVISAYERPPVGGGEAEPGEPVERALLRWQVESALERLTPEHREVLRLAHPGGLGVGEIAALTGLPAATVKSRIHYALHGLRLALDEMEAL